MARKLKRQEEFRSFVRMAVEASPFAALWQKATGSEELSPEELAELGFESPEELARFRAIVGRKGAQ